MILLYGSERRARRQRRVLTRLRAHVGVDAQSGLVPTVKATEANVNDLIEANGLLEGRETDTFGDAGYQGRLYYLNRHSTESQLKG